MASNGRFTPRRFRPVTERPTDIFQEVGQVSNGERTSALLLDEQAMMGTTKHKLAVTAADAASCAFAAHAGIFHDRSVRHFLPRIDRERSF